MRSFLLIPLFAGLRFETASARTLWEEARDCGARESISSTCCPHSKKRNLGIKEIQDFDFKYCDLAKWSFRNSKLVRNNFSGTKLNEAQFAVSEMHHSNFSDARLRGILAPRSRWMSCNLSGARMDGAKLIRSSFSGSTLQGASLQNAVITFADFGSTDLRGADLRNTIYIGTNFKNARIDAQTQLPFDLPEALRRGMIFER